MSVKPSSFFLVSFCNIVIPPVIKVFSLKSRYSIPSNTVLLRRALSCLHFSLRNCDVNWFSQTMGCKLFSAPGSMFGSPPLRSSGIGKRWWAKWFRFCDILQKSKIYTITLETAKILITIWYYDLFWKLVPNNECQNTTRSPKNVTLLTIFVKIVRWWTNSLWKTSFWNYIATFNNDGLVKSLLRTTLSILGEKHSIYSASRNANCLRASARVLAF